MKPLLRLLSIIFLFSAQLANAQICADTNNIYKFKYHGKRYEVVKEMKSWDSAASCAVKRGGYLAQINSAAEQDSLYYAITTGAGVSSTYTSVTDGGNKAYVWIGATDKHTEGTWLWDGNNDNTGVNFWNGQGDVGAGGGAAVSGLYNHWGGRSSTSGVAKEPDNFGTAGQDAAGIALAAWPYGIAGEWNDINIANTLYYVIEYDSSTAINDLQNTVNEHSISLYPNPARTSFSIRSNNAADKIATITMFNQLGAVIVTTNEPSLNVANLTAGFYIVTVEFDNGDRLRKQLLVE